MQKFRQIWYSLGQHKFNTYDFIAAMLLGVGLATGSAIPFPFILGLFVLSFTHPRKEY